MAGFFGIGDFTKEGAGISKNRAEKKRFFLFWEIFWRKAGKLIGLNLLYLLCCLPIVTIGPATAGMMYVLRNMANERPTFVIADFFDAFKKNFKQGFVVGILQLLFFAVDIYGVFFYYSWATQNPESPVFGMVALIIALSFGFVLLFMSFYVYLMMVTCDLKLKPLIKNSFILALVGFKTNIITTLALLLVLVVILLPLVPYLCWPLCIVLFCLYGASMPGFIVAFNSYKYITKYVTDPYYEEHEDEKKEITEEAVFDDDRLL